MLILGIDTTEKNIHIALSEDASLLAEIEENSNKTEELINFMDRLFKAAGKKADRLSAIGVITGPGGYTGTRAGVSVAKTLSQFLNIPIVGFNKLEAILLSFNSEAMVAPMIDIKKNEVYACIAHINNGTINYQSEPAVYTFEQWLELLKQQEQEIILLGAEFISKKELFNCLPANIKMDYEFYLKPSYINLITKQMVKDGKASTFKEILPFYIREAI